MAKQKIEKESLDAFLKRQYGEGILCKASDITDRPRDVLKTALSLDIALTGGIPEGKVVLISGKPKAGKTYLCLGILNNAIEDKRPAFYFNIERRCTPGQVEQVCGDNAKKLNWVESTADRILTAEDWLTILERVIKDNPKSVIVVDSLAQLSTMVEQSEALGSNKDMAGPAKLSSSFFRRMMQTTDSNNVILIFISHMISNRDKTSRKKWVEKGGVAVQYACSVWINASWVQLWDTNKDTNEIDGQNVHFRILCSALGKPYIPCVVPIRYGTGVDMSLDVAINAENLGLIEKAGAWYSIPMFAGQDGKAPRFQGMNNLTRFLREDESSLTKLANEVRKILLPDVKYNGSQATQGRNNKNKSVGKAAKKSK